MLDAPADPSDVPAAPGLSWLLATLSRLSSTDPVPAVGDSPLETFPLRCDDVARLEVRDERGTFAGSSASHSVE